MHIELNFSKSKNGWFQVFKLISALSSNGYHGVSVRLPRFSLTRASILTQ